MTSELGQRLGFTIGALLVYRLGTYIPLPGIDSAAWAQIFRSAPGGNVGLSGLLSGGGVHRMAVFALGLTPLLSAAIMLQLVSIAFPGLRALPRAGERGRSRFAGYTLFLAIVLAVFQAFGVAGGLESVPMIVIDPGWLFRVTTVLTLTAGTVFLVWLAGQITTRGIGNGLSLILFSGVVFDLPAALAGMIELGRRGSLATSVIVVAAVFVVAITGLIVFMELAQRRLVVTYPGRQVGTRLIEGQAHLPVKLNSAGVIPAILASWLLLVPIVLVNLRSGEGQTWIMSHLAPGQPLYLILYVLATVVCVYIYSAFVLDPEEVAEDLKRRGGAIAGIEPGEATAEHVDYVVSRTTLIGAAYLAAVILIPEILVAYGQVPFRLSGMSLLILVCAILDIDAQLQGPALLKLGGQRR